MFCRSIFSGYPNTQLPDIIRTYTLGPEGRFIYISGWNFFLRRTDLALTHSSSLWIYDCLQLKSSIISLDCEDFIEVVDFYSLNANECVLMTFDQQYGLLTQNLLVMNRENTKTICELKRNWKFNAVQKSIKIGLGGIAFGYIVVGGITSVELGEILMVRLLPADPRSLYHRAINLDPQINQLETLIKQQPNELFIWPLSTIMLNNTGVYLPLARSCDHMLIFESSLIGAIEFLSDGNFDVKLIEVDDSDMRGACERDLCINYVSMMAQRGRSAWMTSIVPADPSHWRWKLQRMAVSVCRFLLLYFGTFFLWLSQYDGGWCAYWFGRFYLWLLGGRVNPNLGPKPSFYMYVLDMKNWRISKRFFKVNTGWLHAGGQAMIDANDRGGIILSEVTRECDQIKITSFPPPFVPEPLSVQAFYRCHELYPKLRSAPELCKEWGIINYTSY
uniref:Uncharacterized protein n=1 Tax=Parascaris univalens TaxID=6257 RepID=A0A915AAK5_PARUN